MRRKTSLPRAREHGRVQGRGEQGSDDDLVGRAREGDESAFAELFRRHGPSLRAVCARVLGYDDPDLDDALQEALTSSWKSLDQLRGAFGPWARRVAHNSANNVLRRRLRRREEPLDDNGSTAAPITPPPLDSDTEHDALGEVGITELLAVCTPRQRDIVRLRFLHGLSYAAIAGHLGIGVDTVKKACQEALKTMRQQGGRDEVRGVGTEGLELPDVRLGFVPKNLRASLTKALREKALWLEAMYERPGGRAKEVFNGFARGSRTAPPVPPFAADWQSFSVAMLMSHLAFCVLRSCPRHFKLPYDDLPPELEETPTCGQRKVRWNICHVGGLVFDDVDDSTSLMRYEALLERRSTPTRALALRLAHEYFEHHLDVTLQ